MEKLNSQEKQALKFYAKGLLFIKIAENMGLDFEVAFKHVFNALVKFLYLYEHRFNTSVLDFNVKDRIAVRDGALKLGLFSLEDFMVEVNE